MNHEPECPNRFLWQPPEWVNDDCAYCQVLRAAYQRGRTDSDEIQRTQYRRGFEAGRETAAEGDDDQ